MLVNTEKVAGTQSQVCAGINWNTQPLFSNPANTMLVCLPPFYNKWTQTSHLKVLSLKILDSFWLTRLRLAGTSQRGWTAMRLTSTLIRTWAERMRWTQLGVFITVLLASSLFIRSFTNKHTCHTHGLFWNGVFLNWSTWLIEKFHFCITILQRAASAVLLRGQKPKMVIPSLPELTQAIEDVFMWVEGCQRGVQQLPSGSSRDNSRLTA